MAPCSPGLLPLVGQGLLAERLNLHAIDLAFALVWIDRYRVRAGGGASRRNFTGLAALHATGGAGLVDVHHVHLVFGPRSRAHATLVEIVTTVLILLGLRWLPKRQDEATAPDATRRC